MKQESKWSSRKFWSAMLWQACNVVLVYNGTISESVFETLTFLLLGGYFLSNVAQKKIVQKIVQK